MLWEIVNAYLPYDENAQLVFYKVQHSKYQ